MKRLNKTAAAVLALGLLLGGCGSKTAGLRVSLFAESDIINIMRARLAAFEAETGIHAEAVYIPYAQYEEKLTTQLAAGTAPDVIWADTGLFTTLYVRGAFVPLDGYLKADQLDLSDFYPALTDFFTRDGKLYALPQDTAPIACVYYNKALFRERGVPFPKDDWTWDQFLKACLKLAHDKPGGGRVYAFKDNYGPLWDGTVYANGGRLVDDVVRPTRLTLDSPEAIEAVQFLADLIVKHRVTPAMAERSSAMALGQDDLMQGRVAMVRTGLWITPSLRAAKGLDWDIVPFPRGPRARKPAWPTGGSGYTITKDAKDRDQAWRLVRFLASPESQMAYAATGYAQPARRKLASSAAFLKSAPPANKAWLLKAPEFAVYDPREPRWREILNGMIAPALDRVWIGQAGAEETLKRVTQEVNARYFSKH